MIGIVIVDGTGTDVFVAPNNDQYRVDYANSHCSRIAREFPHTTYQRGPWLDGFNMGQTIEEAYIRSMGFIGNGACKGLCLIGHSRGGAAVIAVAHRLKEKGIDVGFLGLFDAVEMDCNFRWDVDQVPDNVKSVYHVERQMATLSRHLWGNCGDSWAGGTLMRSLLWGTLAPSEGFHQACRRTTLDPRTNGYGKPVARSPPWSTWSRRRRHRWMRGSSSSNAGSGRPWHG